MHNGYKDKSALSNKPKRKVNANEAKKLDDLAKKLDVELNKANVAYVEGIIDGKSIDNVANSGKTQPGSIPGKPIDKMNDLGTMPSDKPGGRKLSTSPTSEDLARNNPRTSRPDRRAHDSEIKLLEDMLDKTSTTSKGNIKLVSERDLCSSCSNALDEFRKMRPDIDVEVVFRTPYP